MKTPTPNHASTRPSHATGVDARRRCGFATFTAVALVGTTALALTALAGLAMHQADRAQTAAEDAQLRQLLHAGMLYNAPLPNANDDASAPYRVPLPDTLDPEDASLTIRATAQADVSPQTRVITATLNGRTATQTLRYDAQTAAWHVVEVQMP